MTIPSCLSSEMHLQKSLDQTEFQSWVVNFRAEVCAKAKNLALALQWIKKIEAASSLKDLIKINYEQRVLWFWRIGFDDGGRIETVLRKVSALPKEDPRRKSTELKRTTDFSEGVRLPIWSTKLQSVESWQQERGKIIALSGRLEHVSSERQLGLVQEETLVVFSTRMLRETVRQCGSGWRKKISLGASILFSTAGERTDWREKLKQSRGLRLELKSLVYGWQHVQDRRVIIGIIPCVVVTSLETDAFMAIVASCWWLEETQREVEKRRYSRSSCYFKEKKKVQGCVCKNSDPMNSILRKAEELGLNASAGHTMECSGCTWYETKIRERNWQSGGIIQKGEPHERNPGAPKFEERTPGETSRQEDCVSKAAWNLVRKNISSRLRTKLRLILLWKQRHPC